MRGDAFIHFVCGSRRVNIRLGVLLLILKSPQSNRHHSWHSVPLAEDVMFTILLKKIKIQPNRSEQETKRSQSFLVYCIRSNEKMLQKKSFLKKSGSGGFNEKWKAVATAIKDSTPSIRKHPNELKVREKTVWTAIKDLSPDLNPLMLYGAF